MTTTALHRSRDRGPAITLDKLVAYWSHAYADVMPDLPAAAIGWGEPFCFHCGWLAPTPLDGFDGSWQAASGWLERAHLQDHMTGGTEQPENLVPLCVICHRGMPDFADSREAAVAWVKAQDHDSCPPWWQSRSDTLWGGERWRPFPGRLDFINAYVKASEGSARTETAVACFEAGDLAGLQRALTLVGLPKSREVGLLSAFVDGPALKQATS